MYSQYLLTEIPGGQEKKEPWENELGTQIRNTKYHEEVRVNQGSVQQEWKGAELFSEYRRKNMRREGLVALRQFMWKRVQSVIYNTQMTLAVSF